MTMLTRGYSEIFWNGSSLMRSERGLKDQRSWKRGLEICGSQKGVRCDDTPLNLEIGESKRILQIFRKNVCFCYPQESYDQKMCVGWTRTQTQIFRRQYHTITLPAPPFLDCTHLASHTTRGQLTPIDCQGSLYVALQIGGAFITTNDKNIASVIHWKAEVSVGF